MMLYLFLLFTVCAVRYSSAADVERGGISYDNLKKMNASCSPRDTCAESRANDSPEISPNYACSCDRLCSKLSTCCIDSPHKDTASPTVRPRCRSADDTPNPRGFYMVDRCVAGGGFNPVWETLCEEEWKGEDNVIKIAPVTSLFTSMTYKNYFCFRCHENTQEFLFWNVQLLSHQDNSSVVSENANFGVVYDRDNETWLALGADGASIPVNLKFQIPGTMRSLAMPCDPDVISNCSNPSADDDVRRSCSAYTAIVFIRKEGRVLKYKNVHCALCSSESLQNMACEHADVTVLAPRKSFSFTYLIDINRLDGDRVGKIKKCGDNFIWDPYGEKCRKIACAVPGYTVKDGQCVPP